MVSSVATNHNNLLVVVILISLLGCDSFFDDTDTASTNQKWNQAIINGSEEPLVLEQISKHFGPGSGNGRLEGIESEDIGLDSVIVLVSDSVYNYVVGIDDDPSDINFKNFLLVYRDGMISATLIEFFPDPDWHFNFGRKADNSLDWAKYTGQMIVTNLNSNVSDTINMINGQNEFAGRSGGRAENMECGMVLYEITTDWYTNGDYSDTWTTYSWEYECTFIEPDMPELSIPSGVGSSTSKVISVCTNCTINKPVITYDANGDPVDNPCMGDPLARMAIMSNNQGIESNRFGCVRSGSNCKINPQISNRKAHGGIDLQAEMGTPVYSVNNGVVNYVSLSEHSDFGYWVVIEYAGHFFAYAHLDQPSTLKVGDRVQAGITVIGVSGHSGNAESQYPHLHFAVREITGTGRQRNWNNATMVNPENWLVSVFDSNGNVSYGCN